MWALCAFVESGVSSNVHVPTCLLLFAVVRRQLSKKSFPLCMQQLHQGLRAAHHLKHWGRMQYGLFLKAIGLSLDEAMKFWRTEFIKTIDADKVCTSAVCVWARSDAIYGRPNDNVSGSAWCLLHGERCLR